MKEVPKLNESIKELSDRVILNPVFDNGARAHPHPLYYKTRVLDQKTKADIGFVRFYLNLGTKTIKVDEISLTRKRQGYGVSVYKKIQELYPEFTLQSTDNISLKDDLDQEFPNAIYLWEKLVRLGLAVKISKGVYKMVKTK